MNLQQSTTQPLSVGPFFFSRVPPHLGCINEHRSCTTRLELAAFSLIIRSDGPNAGETPGSASPFQTPTPVSLSPSALRTPGYGTDGSIDSSGGMDSGNRGANFGGDSAISSSIDSSNGVTSGDGGNGSNMVGSIGDTSAAGTGSGSDTSLSRGTPLGAGGSSAGLGGAGAGAGGAATLSPAGGW